MMYILCNIFLNFEFRSNRNQYADFRHSHLDKKPDGTHFFFERNSISRIRSNAFALVFDFEKMKKYCAIKIDFLIKKILYIHTQPIGNNVQRFQLALLY
jgi:hypothetical protein